MTPTSIDLSRRTELTGLAQVVQSLEPIAGRLGMNFFLMGAAARDLLLVHASGVNVPRATADVDFGVMVADWQAFDGLRRALIGSGDFKERPGPPTHRMRHRSGLPLDIVPFGGVERPDRTLLWPPENSEVFDCFGMKEALADSVSVALPGGVSVRVASVPTQAVLKMAAWNDRKHTHPGRDAGDLFLLLRHYLDLTDNMDRALEQHADLFEVEPFDHEETAVRLLARDMNERLDAAGVQRVAGLLVPEADEAGPLLLAGQSGLELERARRLIEVLCDELGSVAGGR